MNRATRDRFASGTQKDLTSGNACWETAPAVYKQLRADYGPFDIDLTADPARALARRWFGPGSKKYPDALSVPWHEVGGSGFSNPPYGDFVARILPKAKQEAALGFRSLFLLPLRVTRAFRAHVLRGASDLILPDSRLVFFENGLPRCSYDKKGRPHADCAMFDSMLVQYLPGGRRGGPRLSEWRVPSHVTQVQIDEWAALHPWRAVVNNERASDEHEAESR